MTIAACAVTAEGVVLGADSTSTLTSADDSQRYLNNEQKLFEVGEGSTLGVVTWGMGRMNGLSYRTLVARLADDFRKAPPSSVLEAANLFAAKLWPAYDSLRPQIDKQKAIVIDPKSTPKDIERAKGALANLTVGFCLAGHNESDRESHAYEVIFAPDLTAAPVPKAPPVLQFWGANLFIFRMLGFDTGLADTILKSGKWTGDPAELAAIFKRQQMPILAPIPLRETVDIIHALIHMTIKVMKFTSVPPVCGGHIEIATITTDRKFRWVRHKALAAALDNP